ncbi:unnamed protein product [Pleuronectes platessa]|uniref:Uncharacterized protein n=1 Tax=Pleuronectes platessa TaxID=8262 RepID=A0A9N7Z7B5_PLEPL|nr:unnamed protein product [Pleuronectes platessa]
MASFTYTRSPTHTRQRRNRARVKMLMRIAGVTAAGSRHSTLTSHAICVATSHHRGLKLNLSCQQHDGPGAPDLYSEQFVRLPPKTGPGGGGLSPHRRRRAVTVPPETPERGDVSTRREASAPDR